jgi:NitT/TauT family transport system permease protein
VFWLGIGNVSRIVLAIISSLIPITLSGISATKNVDQSLVWSARTMGVSEFQVLYKVILPASLPTILSGIRIGNIFSFITIISSEMIIARDGIGVLVSQFASQGRYELFFASVLYIVILVGLINRLFLWSSNRLISWSEEGVSGL